MPRTGRRRCAFRPAAVRKCLGARAQDAGFDTRGVALADREVEGLKVRMQACGAAVTVPGEVQLVGCGGMHREFAIEGAGGVAQTDQRELILHHRPRQAPLDFIICLYQNPGNVDIVPADFCAGVKRCGDVAPVLFAEQQMVQKSFEKVRCERGRSKTGCPDLCGGNQKRRKK